jgi:hypothetical protein
MRFFLLSITLIDHAYSPRLHVWYAVQQLENFLSLRVNHINHDAVSISLIFMSSFYHHPLTQ